MGSGAGSRRISSEGSSRRAQRRSNGLAGILPNGGEVVVASPRSMVGAKAAAMLAIRPARLYDSGASAVCMPDKGRRSGAVDCTFPVRSLKR